VFGTAAEAAYHRGDYAEAERLARSGLGLAFDEADSRYCWSALSVAALARGDFADAVEHALTAATLTVRPGENLVVAALARTYAGDLDEARDLNDRVLAGAVSPTMRAWAAYAAGEIESSAGRLDLAEQQYLASIDLARASGATFLVGVATVGLLSVRVAAGRVREALTGYRDVIDYFDRTGNWTHQWTTLRNLADLLRRLGDDDPAALLDAAADRAPDAPADTRSRDLRRPSGPIPGRVEILKIAREAIRRNLTHS
jgi:tetratricopeptide (TPR) repeat protein